LARKNVSQYTNDFRIAEACRLLRETDMSVTAAMFESGFQTKSNFNREFRRVTFPQPGFLARAKPGVFNVFYSAARLIRCAKVAVAL
jgi:AraC-like DNA-binding protein